MEAVCQTLQQQGERCGDQLWAVQEYELPGPHIPPYTPFLRLAQFAARRARWGGAGAERRDALPGPAAQVAGRPRCTLGCRVLRGRAPLRPGRYAHQAMEVRVEDAFMHKNDPGRAQLEQDFCGLWGRFCSAAAAAGRLRSLRFSLNFCSSALLMRDLAQLRSLLKLDLWLPCLPHEHVGELAHLSSLSALTGLELGVGVSRPTSQTLRLPPELAALPRLESLTGAAGRCRRLPAPARMRSAWAAPHALWRRACQPAPSPPLRLQLP